MRLLNKTFIITEFGKPFSWTQQYINNVQHLQKDGWNWKIFTPNKYEAKGNVEVINMRAEQFNNLVKRKLDVKPNLFITEQGIPSVHVTDFYIFSGVIFEDYLKGVDFWGITNMDVVYGNLSKYVTDELLSDCMVFSDDVNTINGVFSLFKNIDAINGLFRDIENWAMILGQPPCPGCLGKGEHKLCGSDEYLMTNLLRENKYIRFKYPTYYPMLSHDRLEQHVPTPKLARKDNGSLWELFNDINGPEWEHARPVIGKEIPYFHFQRTKSWPSIQS